MLALALIGAVLLSLAIGAVSVDPAAGTSLDNGATVTITVGVAGAATTTTSSSTSTTTTSP